MDVTNTDALAETLARLAELLRAGHTVTAQSYRDAVQALDLLEPAVEAYEGVL